MEIRKIQESETSNVLDLIDEFDRITSKRPSLKTQQQIYASICKTGGCIIGAFIDNKIIATCTLNICSNLSWEGKPFAIVENVIVTKPYRKKGIGKAILTFAKEYAFEKGCYKIALMTGSKKPETLNFYESAGFSGDKTGFQIRNPKV